MASTRTIMKSFLATVSSLLLLGAATTADAQPFAYIPNDAVNNLSVIDTATNTVVATVTVGVSPFGIAVNPGGARAYVTNAASDNVSVIDTANFTVVATVAVGTNPEGIAVNPAGTRAYVGNRGGTTLSVIDTATNTVVATVTVGTQPQGVAVNPGGTRVYVTNRLSNSVSVIDTTTNAVVATIVVGTRPHGVAVNPAGTFAYVANDTSNNVTVIDTATNMVVATVPVGSIPQGISINPAGTRAYVANYTTQDVSVIDTATNAVVATVPVGGNPWGISVNPAGTRIYVVTNAGLVAVIDSATNNVVATVPIPSGAYGLGAFIGGPAVTVPGAPTIGTATAGNGSATVSYTPPGFNGGSTIFTYTATSSPGGITGSATGGPVIVSGLTNGTPYTFTVTATNTVGTSPPSAASNSVSPGLSATYAPAGGLDFGMRTTGVVSPSMQATFTNTSATILSLSSISFTGGGAGFNVLPSSQCLMTPMLSPSASCTVDITVTPNALGLRTDSVFILTTPANTATPTALPLAVTGVAPSPIFVTVTNTADSGPGSLRQAITDANAGGSCAPSATITFNIAAAGPQTISPGSPLPTVACQTTIDGYTQPGASANTLSSSNNATLLIALDGTSMTPPAPGLTLTASNTVIRGLVIKRFIGQPGISIQGGTGVRIEGNFIGTDATGTVAAPNGIGIATSSGGIGVIGNLTPAGRNVISGNTGHGIAIAGIGPPAVGTSVENNHIGTDKAGATALPNGGNGVNVNALNAYISQNLIRFNTGNGVSVGGFGGYGAIRDNDIFGNGANGIFLPPTECMPQGMAFRRNYIGVQGLLGIDLGDTLLGAGRDINSTILTSPSCYHGNGGMNVAPFRAQNYPVLSGPITYAFNGAGVTTTINAVLNTSPTPSNDIDLFDNLGYVDSTNRGIGATYISSTTVFPDAAGNVAFQITATGTPVYHPTMTASTPFAPTGGTSEISVQAVTPLIYTSSYTNFSIIAGGSQSQTFTFFNADSVPVTTVMPSTNLAAFTVTSNTCAPVAAGATCQVVVRYSQAVASSDTATLTIGPITSAAPPVAPVTLQPSFTYTWALVGTATALLVTAAPTSLIFASTAQGTQSLPQTVTISNADSSAITLGAPGISPAEFFIAGTTCGTSLAALSSCTITIKLSPFPTSNPGTTSGGLTLPLAAGGLFVGLAGTIATYSATALPSPVTFASTVVFTNAIAQTVTFTNNSTGTVNITAVNITGTDIADFQLISTTCAGIVASTASCTASVRFSPQSLGAKNADVRFDSGGLSSLAALMGTGISPAPVPPTVALSLSQTTTAPGNPVGLVLNIANPGGTALSAGAFTFTYPAGVVTAVVPGIINSCGGTVTSIPGSTTLNAGGLALGAGNTCAIGVSVSAATSGSYVFTFAAGGFNSSVGSNAAASSATLTVSTLLPPSISFAAAPGSIVVNGTSVGTLTINNPNATPLVANGFTFNYLPGLVNAPVPNPSSTCVGAAPTAAPGASFSTQPVSFTLPAGGSCTFSVTFTSATAGTYSGNIAAGLIVTPAGSSNATPFNLTVTAAPAPAVTLVPTSVNFGTRTVNTTSPPSTVSLGNSGTALLSISSITASGDFAFTTSCPLSPSTLAVSLACPINITFTPLAATLRSGNISIASNAPGSPHTIALSGTGSAAAVPGISFAPTALNFGAPTVNTTSATQNVVVTNTGFANLTLSGISVTAPFSRVPLGTVVPADCGTSVAPSSSCQIGVRFAPTGVGAFAGQISIVDNATGSPHTVALSGTGTPIPVPVISTNGAIVFGDQVINSTASVQSVSLGNTGTATLTISAITLTGTNAANFTLTGQSGCTSIAPAGTCTLTVTFATTSTGAKIAQVNITSNAQNAALVNTVSLSGNGILAPRPIANLSMTAAGFGNVIFGGATPNQIITLSNGGGQVMTISSIVVVGDFVQSNNCGTSLASLASCTINVLFTPLGQGIRSGELIVTTSAASSPDRVPVSGTGCRWFSQSQSRFFLTNCG